MLAVYLAEEINITTLEPIYASPHRSRAAPEGTTRLKPRGESASSALLVAQQQRRVWTHPACDTDGDGVIADCDISAAWK